jgi:hypothetical protein
LFGKKFPQSSLIFCSRIFGDFLFKKVAKRRVNRQKNYYLCKNKPKLINYEEEYFIVVGGDFCIVHFVRGEGVGYGGAPCSRIYCATEYHSYDKE